MSIASLSKSTADTTQVSAKPIFFDLVTFHGDSAYPTGGSAGFTALVRTLFGDQRTPLAVIKQDCGGFGPVYDAVNDKLKVYAANNTEVANTTDLSATTFTVLIISY